MTRVSWVIFFHLALTVTAQQQPYPTQPDPGQPPSKTVVFSVLLTLFFLIGFLSVYIRRCTLLNPNHNNNNHHRNPYAERPLNGLSPSIVETFPVFSYSKVKDSNNDLECSICLNEFQELEKVRLVPTCNHVFHVDCIGTWLCSHVTCPVCRSDLTVEIKDQVTIEIKESNCDITGGFYRSNSTGHSLDRDFNDRFILSLPGDLKRARSFDSVLTGGSGGDSGRVDQLGLFVTTTKSNSGSV